MTAYRRLANLININECTNRLEVDQLLMNTTRIMLMIAACHGLIFHINVMPTRGDHLSFWK